MENNEYQMIFMSSEIPAILFRHSKNTQSSRFCCQCVKLSITQAVKQGYSLLPILCKIYVDHIVEEWKVEVNSGLKISQGTAAEILLFAHDLTILLSKEDDLQKL